MSSFWDLLGDMREGDSFLALGLARLRINEAVAFTADGEEVGGGGGVEFDFSSERGDEVIDGAGAGVGVVAPDDVEESFAGHGFAFARNEEPEDAEFFGGEFGGRSVTC